MIYKKTGNKIPSLSSLLLTSVLFGSSGCGEKNKHTSTRNLKDKVETGYNDINNSFIDSKIDSEGKENIEKNNNEFKKEFSSHLAEAVRKFKEIFIKDCVKLGYLNVIPAQDSETREREFRSVEQIKNINDKKNKLLAILTSSCDLLAGVKPFPVPKELENVFRGLQNLPNSKIAKKYPYASASAIEHILKRFEALYSIKEKMFKSISDLTPEAVAPNLLIELDEVEKKVEDILQPTYEFIDNAKGTHAILDGASLCRFFNGKSKDGHQYPEVESLFTTKEIEPIWIKFKQTSDKSVIPTIQADTTSSTSLNKRGIGISDNWKVEGGEKSDVMPRTDCIDNSRNIFGEPLLKRFVTIAGTKDSLNGNNNELCIQALGLNEKCNAEAATKTSRIKVGQLVFFTLAKGKSRFDFLELAPSSWGDEFVKLIGKNDKYILWRNAAHEGNDSFAQFLGEHIRNSTELQNLFVIPDQDTLESALFSNMDESKPANGGTNAVQCEILDSNNPISSDGIIGRDAQSTILYKNILSLFSFGHQQISDNADDLQKKIDELANLSLVNSDAVKTDLTFIQHVTIAIARELKDNKLVVTSMQPGSTRTLKETVKAVIDSQMQNVILKIKSGRYVSTNITAGIKDAIVVFDKQLDKKNKNAHVTYEQIKLDRRVKDFDIDKVRNVLLSGCRNLRTVIESDVVSTIQTPIHQNVNYVSCFQDIPGISTLFDKDFDQIRKDYHDKLDK